jgi:hypothetical protein
VLDEFIGGLFVIFGKVCRLAVGACSGVDGEELLGVWIFDVVFGEDFRFGHWGDGWMVNEVHCGFTVD